MWVLCRLAGLAFLAVLWTLGHLSCLLGYHADEIDDRGHVWCEHCGADLTEW